MRMVLPGVLALLAAAGVGRAESFEQQRDAEAAKSPAGVTFELSLDKGSYHLGERVGMTYRETSAEEGKYILYAGTYDRSGRMMSETFHLDPGDVTDPLAGYFAMQGVMIGGGLTATPALGEKPVELHFDLNEWVRFDHPGKYRLYVSARRVTEKGAQGVAQAAVSNIVTFEVLPADEAWSRGQLEEIREILAGKPNQEEQREAYRRLRFLDTPEASLEMARRLDGTSGDDWDLAAGLMGASDRKAALAALEQRLTAPDQGVSVGFLTAIENVAALNETPTTAPTTGMAAYSARQSENQQRLREALTKYVTMVSKSVGQKDDKARAVTLAALQRAPANAVLVPDADLATALAAVFDELPVADQVIALRQNWAATKTAALLPHLLKIVQGEPGTTNEALELRNWALARAYELDPAGVRPLVLAEMRHPVSSMQNGLENRLESLMVLPDETLPEMNDDFVRLMQEPSLDIVSGISEVVARYGTKEIEPQMVAVFERRGERWACAPEAGMLAYFLRVDGAYGKELFAKCLAARQTGCWRDLFGSVGKLVWTPELEELARGALDDPDAGVALSAAQVLKRKGNEESLEALMAALGRPYVGNPPADQLSPKEPEKARRAALVDALLHGHHWVLTQEQFSAVEAKAVDGELVEEFRNEAAAKDVGVQLMVGLDGQGQGYVEGEYYGTLAELERKVGMYPAGVAVQLVGTGMPEWVVRSFKEWASGQGREVR